MSADPAYRPAQLYLVPALESVYDGDDDWIASASATHPQAGEQFPGDLERIILPWDDL